MLKFITVSFIRVERAREIFIQILFIIKSILHSRDLTVTLDNTKNIRRQDILLFCTLRNEAPRIPYFLDYYRKLGVDHFIFVDNESTDGFLSLVNHESDVSVWFTNASYKNSSFGMHWLNYLLRKYGRERWCLICDPDEFIVFPNCDKRNFHELVEFLDSENKRSFFCLMIDMYSKNPVSETIYISGQDPLEVAPYFDKTGYVQTFMPSKETWIQGGARRRVFFADYPERSPALNKIPLIKWRWSYSYFSSTHAAVPFFLNLAHGEHHLSPTGCILHFKFFSFLQHKSMEELARKQHFDGSFEYAKYKSEIEKNTDQIYCEDLSVKFKDFRQLVDLGLMNTGQWF
jgi:hypothetical protein